MAGYPHRDNLHQYCFTDTEHSILEHSSSSNSGEQASGGSSISSLNTLGYSPVPFGDYLEIVRDILMRDQAAPKKPIIFSVTGAVSEIREYYTQIQRLSIDTSSRLLMEINLSCPNISGKPPPAYSEEDLVAHLRILGTELQKSSRPDQDQATLDKATFSQSLEVGIKVP